MRSVLFARVLSTDQTTNPQQLDLLRKRCAQEGDEIVQEFQEMRSVSDKEHYETFDHFLQALPSFQAILKLAEQRMFERLWVYKWDRLSRAIIWGAHLIRQLEQHTIRIESLIEGDNKFVRDLLLALAEHQNRDRILAIPLGYKKCLEEHHVIPGRSTWCIKKFAKGTKIRWRNETVKQLIKDVFRLFVEENRTMMEITTVLQMSRHRFYQIIRDPVCIGKFQWRGTLYPLKLDPLVDPTLYEKAQQKVKRVVYY